MLHGRETRGILRGMALASLVATASALACACVPVSSAQTDASRKRGEVPAEQPAPPTAAIHSITVAFNYDFTKTPACSATVTTGCVSKFKVFDISDPTKPPYWLFTIAVPAGASGKTNPIKASSARMSFEIGRHRLGVSAVTPEGGRSDPALCSTIVSVGPATSN